MAPGHPTGYDGVEGLGVASHQDGVKPEPPREGDNLRDGEHLWGALNLSGKHL